MHILLAVHLCVLLAQSIGTRSQLPDGINSLQSKLLCFMRYATMLNLHSLVVYAWRNTPKRITTSCLQNDLICSEICNSADFQDGNTPKRKSLAIHSCLLTCTYVCYVHVHSIGLHWTVASRWHQQLTKQLSRIELCNNADLMVCRWGNISQGICSAICWCLLACT